MWHSFSMIKEKGTQDGPSPPLFHKFNLVRILSWITSQKKSFNLSGTDRTKKDSEVRILTPPPPPKIKIVICTLNKVVPRLMSMPESRIRHLSKYHIMQNSQNINFFSPSRIIQPLSQKELRYPHSKRWQEMHQIFLF
jgi:hypothetical protein